MFNSKTKEIKTLQHGYDASRGETVVYADYKKTKHSNGCLSFIISNLVPYGGSPKRLEKQSCLAYMSTLEPLQKEPVPLMAISQI